MTIIISASQNSINRKYNYIESNEFQNFLNFLKNDAKSRQVQGGAAPFKAIEQVKFLKLGALRLSVESGGKGLSIEELFKVLIEIAQYDNDLPQILRAHYQFVEEVLRSTDQKFKNNWIKEFAKGVIVGNAYTEPPSNIIVGSNDYQTKLINVGRSYQFSGTKIFSTGTLYADYVSVRVNNEKGESLTVIVPTDREGVKRFDDWDGIGQKFTASGTTVFENVKVFESEINKVPVEQVKFKPFTQLFLQAIIAGIVKAISREAIELVQSRKRTFIYAVNANPRQDPLLLETIGNIAASAYIIENAVLNAAHAQDIAFNSTVEGISDYQLSHQAALEASLVKIAIEPIALSTASKIFDVTGASSTRLKFDLDRHWRNIRTLSSHNPANFKSYIIGNMLVNDQDLPNNAYF